MVSKNKQQTPWINGGVIYQIYIQSFLDSNGDGIGDLGGIIKSLDYLNDGKGNGLGVTGIIISPLYPSPMHDYGYDIMDYCAIGSVFGSMADFESLLKEAHIRGIKVIMDFIPNHSSHKHPWFIEASKSRSNPKRNWYIWRDAKTGGFPPNNWLSVYGGPAWTYDQKTNQYYLHTFLKEQPDLNWENPEVRKAVTDSMHFWLKKGVDGFKISAADYLGKDYLLTDDPINPYWQYGQNLYDKVIHKYSRGSGRYYEYIKILSSASLEYEDRVLLIEPWLTEHNEPSLCLDFYNRVDNHSTIPINFDLALLPWDTSTLQSFIERYQQKVKPEYQPLYALSNYNLPRIASRIGDSNTRLAAMLLCTLPGICFIYNGDEIGMKNTASQTDLTVFNEPQTRNLQSCTPFHWTSSKHAGFSSTQPWIPMSLEYKHINVANQITDKNSLLQLYKQLIRLRHEIPAISHGNYKPGPAQHKNVMSYFRHDEQSQFLILMNFSNEPVKLLRIPKFSRLYLSTNKDRTSIEDKILSGQEGIIIEVLK